MPLIICQEWSYTGNKCIVCVHCFRGIPHLFALHCAVCQVVAHLAERGIHGVCRASGGLFVYFDAKRREGWPVKAWTRVRFLSLEPVPVCNTYSSAQRLSVSDFLQGR